MMPVSRLIENREAMTEFGQHDRVEYTDCVSISVVRLD